jgi:hypothetical protein
MDCGTAAKPSYRHPGYLVDGEFGHLCCDRLNLLGSEQSPSTCKTLNCCSNFRIVGEPSVSSARHRCWLTLILEFASRPCQLLHKQQFIQAALERLDTTTFPLPQETRAPTFESENPELKSSCSVNYPTAGCSALPVAIIMSATPWKM